MSQHLGTYWKRIMGDIPKKATDNVLQEPSGLLFDELVHHVAQNSPNSIEALVGRANVVQSMVIKKDLLHDENGDSLAQFGAGLHDAQAQWDNFCCEEKVDDIRAVVLDQGANDTEGGQTEIFEWPRFGSRVQEWV